MQSAVGIQPWDLFKVLGALTLIIPQVSKQIKEWAYAGFAFEFIFAAGSHGPVDGIPFQTFFPVIFLGILLVSFRAFQRAQESVPAPVERPLKQRNNIDLGQVA